MEKNKINLQKSNFKTTKYLYYELDEDNKSINDAKTKEKAHTKWCIQNNFKWQEFKSETIQTSMKYKINNI